MANFDAQVTELVGGTVDQAACDQWAVDGAREIIMQLPVSLQERCSDKTTLSNSPTTLDLDDSDNGKVLYCTRNNGSYDIPCRLVDPVYAHLTEDSTATNYYAVADDPAYFIRDNKVEIKPTPTASQNGFVYHIIYPTSIDVSAVSSIANFPIECEHLLVLYIAVRQLGQYQNTMTSSWQADITTAIDAVNTALDRIASHNWGDTGNFQNGDLIKVKDALDNAQNLIDNNAPASSYDAYDQLQNEDLELMSGALQIASTEMNRASSHLSEWSALGGMAVQEANGFIAEANSRLQLETTKYGWYGDQYAKLSAEYAKGRAALKGT